MSSALATVTWIDYVRIRMVQMGLSREKSMQRDSTGGDKGGVEKSVENYLRGIGIGQGMGVQ